MRNEVWRYLLRLANPASFILVRPGSPKSHLPRVLHPLRHWVLQAFFAIFDSLFDSNGDCPATIRRVFKVLLNGVVIFLPSVEITLAKVARNVVGARRSRLVEEARLRKL